MFLIYGITALTYKQNVIIGSTIYSLKECNIKDYGECNHEEATITIRKGLPDKLKYKTLIHEIFHTIWEEYGLPTSNEESMVKRLENGFTSFCMNNPSLAKKIVKELIKKGS